LNTTKMGRAAGGSAAPVVSKKAGRVAGLATNDNLSLEDKIVK
jgi:hypothetical protein